MTKWSSQTFLDTLKDASDPVADACVGALAPDVSLIYEFSRMRADTELPSDLPAPFRVFLATPSSYGLSDLGPDDRERIRRGQRAFLTHALPMALALLCKSLTEGYQAPRLSRVLMISGELRRSTYRRCLGVLQMLVNINEPGSFDITASEQRNASASHGLSEAALTAMRMRLMHAGIRQMSGRNLPDFHEQLGGVPVSLEDMLFTIIAFSLHVLQGIELLNVPISAEEREDYYYVWKVYARFMGIHPPGQPMSWEYIPANLAEAQEFNLDYACRHFTTAERNPDGTQLARAQAQMIAERLTFGLTQAFAPTSIPRIFFERLVGVDACRNIGIRPVRRIFFNKWLVLTLPRAWAAGWRAFDRLRGRDTTHIELARHFFQWLIVGQYDGSATWLVARRPEEVEQLVRGTRPGLEYGRQQFRQSVFPAELAEIGARRTTLELDVESLKGPPSTTQGLVGLALSGGGIRSAAFALGAVQALAHQKLLRVVDYLSTVGGGGYLGAAVSSVLTDPDARLDGRAFPLDYQAGQEEPPGVRHVRNGSNYLMGNDLMSEIRLPTIILRGLLINGALFMPYVMMAAWATWVSYPYAIDHHLLGSALFIVIVTFLTVMISYPAFSWWFGRKFTWEFRDRYEKFQALTFAALVIAILGGLLAVPVHSALGSDWTSFTARVRTELEKPFEAADAWKWALLLVTTFALLSAGRVSKTLSRRANTLFILLLGVVGPAVLFGIYLLLLVVFARSPHLPMHDAALISMITRAGPSGGREIGLARRRLSDDLRARGVVLDASKPIETVERDVRWRLMDIHDNAHTVTRTSDLLELGGVEFGTAPQDWWFIGAALLVFLLNGLWVDVNVSSAHGFYRDRLSKAFLFRARWYGPITPNDGQKLSTLGTVNAVVPYHLINTALNLNNARMSDLPGRRSDFFVFSKRFVGSYATGYCDTATMEAADPMLNLGTAMAISGASAAPNSGTTTVRSLTFILTLLNVRLGYWLPNPWYVQATSRVRRLRLRQRPGPNYLLREGLGLLNAQTSFVNISDGGHIENLGIYELLRRRCKVIIAIDAEVDPALSCPSLATLTRYARTDLGLEIRIDSTPFRLDPNGNVSAQWTVGTIHYSDNQTGYLLYVKSSLTGSEAPYVLDYRRNFPTFPHESTSDQFFDETKFEAYRALGFEATTSAVESISAADAATSGHPATDHFPQLRRALGFHDA